MKIELREYNGQMVEVKVHETQALSPTEKRQKKLLANAAERLAGGTPEPVSVARGRGSRSAAVADWIKKREIKKEKAIKRMVKWEKRQAALITKTDLLISKSYNENG